MRCRCTTTEMLNSITRDQQHLFSVDISEFNTIIHGQNSAEGSGMFHSEPLTRPTSKIEILVTPRNWGIFIFCVSLMLRAGYAIVAPHLDPFLIRDPLLGDAASYDRIARTLLVGGAYGEAIGKPSA